MNEIVSNDYKDKLLNKSYKLIYPNDLNLNVTMKHEDNHIIHRLTLDRITTLGPIKFFKNRKNLFLWWPVYNILENIAFKGLTLDFREPNKSEVKKLPVMGIKLLNEQGDEYLERRWTKRIKELYLNVDKRSLVIIIDESFRWPKELKELKLNQERYKKEEDLENKVKSLLDRK